VSRTLEQQIAVFGETGSGKTVLLSSFYGATQEPQYIQSSLFHVVADDIGQGARLHRNYLGMRDSARLPLQTRFTATSYAFSIKLKDGADARAAKKRPFDVLRIVWHDYPGEWFEQEAGGPEESLRRVDTFRSLLQSDVALLLVDGQKLVDNAGEEERYLKSLFTNIRNGLLSLKDDVLEDGKPLVQFPRIWILGLSKADLLPDINAFALRDLLIEKAADELEELRAVLLSFIDGHNAFSFGEDFVLLSSAKFEAGKIEVTERIGLELLLPIAAVLPLERHVRWAKYGEIPRKVAENLLSGAGALATALIGLSIRMPSKIAALVKLIAPDAIDQVVKLVGDELRDANAAARQKHQYLTAALTQFEIDLETGEKEQTLLRSVR
jgi:hypothetical protein